MQSAAGACRGGVGAVARAGGQLSCLLDAAHLRGWRGGNTAADGVLPRCDLHRLMDGGLLEIGRDYQLKVHAAAGPTYQAFDGAKLQLPKSKRDWPKI